MAKKKAAKKAVKKKVTKRVYFFGNGKADGEIYRRYRQRVPGLFPLPWKYLRDSDVQALASDRE